MNIFKKKKKGVPLPPPRILTAKEARDLAAEQEPYLAEVWKQQQTVELLSIMRIIYQRSMEGIREMNDPQFFKHCPRIREYLYTELRKFGYICGDGMITW